MPALTTITTGFDHNYFYKAVVTNSAYTSLATAQIPLRSIQGFTLTNFGPGSTFISFNGTTDHIELVFTNSTPAQFIFDNRSIPGAWFRLSSGVTATVMITAWSSK